jgi:hypothetical protein
MLILSSLLIAMLVLEPSKLYFIMLQLYYSCLRTAIGLQVYLQTAIALAVN